MSANANIMSCWLHKGNEFSLRFGGQAEGCLSRPALAFTEPNRENQSACQRNHGDIFCPAIPAATNLKRSSTLPCDHTTDSSTEKSLRSLSKTQVFTCGTSVWRQPGLS